jgi:hypothetical protein
MAPLSASLVCPSAEVLQTSREVKNYAHRRAKLKRDWYFGTWNVRSLVDNEGSIETARISSEVAEPEDVILNFTLFLCCSLRLVLVVVWSRTVRGRRRRRKRKVM